jgi:prevent-host-death family protein
MFYAGSMERIGVRELNQHTSRYLARVKAGETIEVTEHGLPVAMMIPIQSGVSLLERLVARGEAQPPTADVATIGSLPPAALDGVDVAAELSASRADERW